MMIMVPSQHDIPVYSQHSKHRLSHTHISIDMFVHVAARCQGAHTDGCTWRRAIADTIACAWWPSSAHGGGPTLSRHPPRSRLQRWATRTDRWSMLSWALASAAGVQRRGSGHVPAPLSPIEVDRQHDRSSPLRKRAVAGLVILFGMASNNGTPAANGAYLALLPLLLRQRQRGGSHKGVDETRVARCYCALAPNSRSSSVLAALLAPPSHRHYGAVRVGHKGWKVEKCGHSRVALACSSPRERRALSRWRVFCWTGR